MAPKRLPRSRLKKSAKNYRDNEASRERKNAYQRQRNKLAINKKSRAEHNKARRDAGIYGMSGPVFRVLTDRDWDGQSPAVMTVPGVSAMQAAAAVIGSPLMQDFCAISLSDLLTPWDKIRTRLEAAGQGDFVVALYNPRSKRRQSQLIEAREILLRYRPGETPVGLVGDAFRPGQRVKITTLDDLEKDAEFVDMVTIVIIGNSTTYLHKGKVVTPRGYEEKTGTGRFP